MLTWLEGATPAGEAPGGRAWRAARAGRPCARGSAGGSRPPKHTGVMGGQCMCAGWRGGRESCTSGWTCAVHASLLAAAAPDAFAWSSIPLVLAAGCAARDGPLQSRGAASRSTAGAAKPASHLCSAGGRWLVAHGSFVWRGRQSAAAGSPQLAGRCRRKEQGGAGSAAPS